MGSKTLKNTARQGFDPKNKFRDIFFLKERDSFEKILNVERVEWKDDSGD